MDADRFDALARRLERGASRRGLLILAAALAAAAPNPLEARKKKPKKKRPKPRVCETLGGQITCPAGAVCCDPVRSTAGGCAEAGFPVCCAATPGFAWLSGATCCLSAFAGDEGVCEDPEFPHCCSSVAGAGCCESGFPRCCHDPATDEYYCCGLGESCCPETESGCCADAGRGVVREAAAARPRVRRRHADARAAQATRRIAT